LYGISFITLPSALNGLLKELLPNDVLVDANATLSTTKEGFRLIGPLAGAGLYASVGGSAVAVLDALSFLFAALLLSSLHIQENSPQREHSGWWTEMTAGVRHIGRRRVLLHCTTAIGIALLAVGFTESAIYAVVDAYSKPVEYVGVLVSIQGIGAVAGGLTSGRAVRKIGEPGAVLVGLAICALCGAIIAAADGLWMVWIATILFGFALPWIIVGYMTLLQRQTPQRLMGRVSAASEVILTTPQAVSIAVGALLVSLVDYRIVYVIFAVWCGMAAGYLLYTAGFGQVPAVEERAGRGQIPTESVLAESAADQTVVGESIIVGSADDGLGDLARPHPDLGGFPGRSRAVRDRR
jgi:hypothetical protein